MRLTIAVAAIALLGACAHENVLIPAPGSALGPEGGATGEVAGVRIDVKGDAWKDDPKNLGDFLTPVLVEISNRSDRPVQVRYSSFGLVGQSGFQYAALPPFQPMGTAYGALDAPGGGADPAPARASAERGAAKGAADDEAVDSTGAVRRPPPAIHAAHHRFFVAPYQAQYFGYFSPWPYAFPFDSYYWGQYYYAWVEPLPTPAMMNQALPEGVLQPGGSIGGYVYFQNVSPREGRVTFVANLVDAETQDELGQVRIPLVTARE